MSDEQRYLALGSPGNGYRGSSPWLDFIDSERPRVVAGHAERTGVTAPGLPERAVYQLVQPGGHKLDSLYILEDGAFVPRDEWYAKQGQR